MQEAQLLQGDRAAACLNFGKKYKWEKRASLCYGLCYASRQPYGALLMQNGWTVRPTW